MWGTVARWVAKQTVIAVGISAAGRLAAWGLRKLKGDKKMEKDIAEGKIGEVGKYDVEFKDGKLVALADVEFSPIPEGKLISLELKGSAKAAIDGKAAFEAMIDKLEEVIPGDQKSIAAQVKALAGQFLFK